MTEFMQIFSGNPMTTLVGRKIEQATDPSLRSDDWGLNLEICDIVNETDDGARDAIRAIRKRLVVDPSKNFTVIYRTLTVLETCVNNCNLRFHVLCMNKDFIQELVKLIGPKNDPPIELQERVLSLIERWADAFDTHPELQGVVKVYQELKSKGITFPPQNLDTLAPIQTPRRTLSSSPTNNRDQPTVAILDSSNSTTGSPTLNAGGNAFFDNMSQQQQQQQQHPHQLRRVVTPQHPHQQQQQPEGVLDADGYNKISQELSAVQSSVNVFSEILCQITTKNEQADWTLLEELNTTCRQMKVRVVDLIQWVSNEDLTVELLRLNDELNSVFVKYETLLKTKQEASSTQVPASGTEAILDLPATLSNVGATSAFVAPSTSSTSATTTTTSTTATTSIPRQPTELSLIDFKDEDSGNTTDANRDGESKNRTDNKKPLVNETSQAASRPTGDDPDFDIFAQSRSSIYNDRKAPTNYDPVEEAATNLNRMSLTRNVGPAAGGAPPPTASSSRLPEEISSVREQDFEEIEKWLATDSDNQPPSTDPISIPNSEFENFLASRALAGDKQQNK